MQEIYLSVFGGRDFKNKNRGFLELDDFRKELELKGKKIIAIVSGVSEDDNYDHGADTIGRDYAKEKSIKYIGFPADWSDLSEPCKLKYNSYGKPYNALAGFKRNVDIANKGNEGFCWWDGKSHGTKDTIEKMKDQGKNVTIKKY